METLGVLSVPDWCMPLAYTLLTFTSVLAAYRAKGHPSRLRRWGILGYACCSMLLLPARAADEATLSKLMFALLNIVLMLSLARSPYNWKENQ